jgi:hypothetical protein
MHIFPKQSMFLELAQCSQEGGKVVATNLYENMHFLKT